MAAFVTSRMHVQAIASAKAQRAAPSGHRLASQPEGRMLHVSVSPVGKFFATCGASGHLAVWHTPTYLLVRSLQDSDRRQFFASLAWSPDGSHLATGCESGCETHTHCIVV